MQTLSEQEILNVAATIDRFGKVHNSQRHPPAAQASLDDAFARAAGGVGDRCAAALNRRWP